VLCRRPQIWVDHRSPPGSVIFWSASDGKVTGLHIRLQSDERCLMLRPGDEQVGPLDWGVDRRAADSRGLAEASRLMAKCAPATPFVRVAAR